MSGILYIIATPIGNLSDLSPRAREILDSVDFILAEDTRVTKKLSVTRPLISFHQHSAQSKVAEVIRLLLAGKNYALVTDAGTPNISDPGGKLVAAAHNEGITVSPIPGPNAAIACLSASGFPADEFTFLGYPPNKKGRETWFKKLAGYTDTIVFYESPYRIKKALTSLAELYPDAEVAVCRELTKKFEEVVRFQAKKVPEIREQGEFTVAINKSQKDRSPERDAQRKV